MGLCFRIGVVWVFLLPSAVADIYRCIREDGHVTYQQIRCHEGSSPLSVKMRRSGWTPLRPGEQRLLNRYRKEAGSERRKPYVARPRVRESPACWKRRRQLADVRARLRRGYTLKEDEPLHRKRDEHEDYLATFCR